MIKSMGRECIVGSANVFSLYEDTPLNWDAWDIDVFYENLELEQARSGRPATALRGPVRDVLEFEHGHREFFYSSTYFAGKKQ